MSRYANPAMEVLLGEAPIPRVTTSPVQRKHLQVQHPLPALVLSGVSSSGILGNSIRDLGSFGAPRGSSGMLSGPIDDELKRFVNRVRGEFGRFAERLRAQFRRINRQINTNIRHLSMRLKKILPTRLRKKITKIITDVLAVLPLVGAALLGPAGLFLAAIPTAIIAATGTDEQKMKMGKWMCWSRKELLQP